MDAKTYLHQIKDLDKLINTYQDEIDMLMTRVTSTTQRIKEVNVMTSKENTFDETIAKIIDLRNEINDLIDKYVDMKNAARKIVEQIPQINYQIVLIKYYFQNKTYEQTAVEMNMSYQWICELHKKALKEFEKIRLLDRN
jgi:DNA-directed RNA polymerase specialized sigma subunit